MFKIEISNCKGTVPRPVHNVCSPWQFSHCKQLKSMFRGKLLWFWWSIASSRLASATWTVRYNWLPFGVIPLNDALIPLMGNLGNLGADAHQMTKLMIKWIVIWLHLESPEVENSSHMRATSQLYEESFIWLAYNWHMTGIWLAYDWHMKHVFKWQVYAWHIPVICFLWKFHVTDIHGILVCLNGCGFILYQAYVRHMPVLPDICF